MDTNDSLQMSIQLNSAFVKRPTERMPGGFKWLLDQLNVYLSQSFFFAPFRHSERSQPISETNVLTQDGSNLSQFLFTLNNNKNEIFDKLEDFVHSALPNLGSLRTRVIGTFTEVTFQLNNNYNVHLHNMGGGIEQLLMVGVVLLTSEEDKAIFLEEPESHLHPSAQRFLIENLKAGERQIFLTTHSPIFVDTAIQSSIYMIKQSNSHSSVQVIKSKDELSLLLEEIGSQNSDVLLSDAVLFVEGVGDKAVLEILSTRLNMNLETHGITIVPTTGAADAVRSMVVRSDVLMQISEKSPVPHLFLLDRDERSPEEITKLQTSLKEHLHLFTKRELENYLLDPVAILAAMREKYKSANDILTRVNKITSEELHEIILREASKSYNLVLLKRILARLHGLSANLIPSDKIEELLVDANSPKLTGQLKTMLKKAFKDRLNTFDISKVVSEEKAKLKVEWASPANRLTIAPGEEILVGVFSSIGGSYDKRKDDIRIAQHMQAEKIDSEVRELIRGVISLIKAE